MLIVGESVYEKCASKVTPSHGFSTGMTLSCPFQLNAHKPREEWCKACLLAKIDSLETMLRNVGQMAKDAAASRY